MSALLDHITEKSDLSLRSGLEDHLLYLANADLSQFLVLFKRVRETHLAEATRACVRYLAEHGLDSAGRRMQIWLLANSSYLDLLLDPDFLVESKAFRVASIMRDASCQFSLNLQLRIVKGESACNLIHLDRAIRLAEAFVDPGILISWLRSLTQHSDHFIRSRAAKALCAMRPNPRMIESQMKSPDPRVRANAVEALWSSSGSEAIELLKTALNDDSHRVVVNALVGLHNLRVSGAFEKLITRTQHSSEAMCCAAIWGLGFIGDLRAIPALRTLVRHSSPLISEKARLVLSKLSPLSETTGCPNESVGSEPSPPDSLKTVPFRSSYSGEKSAEQRRPRSLNILDL